MLLKQLLSTRIPGVNACCNQYRRSVRCSNRNTIDNRISGFALQTNYTNFSTFHPFYSTDYRNRVQTRYHSLREYSSLTAVQFEQISEETLESLCEKFEELNELPCCPNDFDITYSAGVLTASIGEGHGTYVINKQIPNAQIWLSSPVSGPKRYDCLNGRWIYSHDGSNLHELLTEELQKIFGDPANFSSCSNS